MDACSRFNSVSEDFVPCVNHPHFRSKLSYVGPKQSDTHNIAEETLRVISVDDLNILEECGVDDKDNLKVEELGNAFSEVLSVLDVHEQSSAHNLIPAQDAICNPKDDSVQQELKILQSGSLDVNTQKGLSKSATFPCSEKVQPSPKPVNLEEEIPSISLCSPNFSKSDKPAYARSTSLPATLKLVSAMKGGREKQEGAPQKTTKLNVKWAPDVYDPPTTSVSHTLNHRHYQRPKAKKKDHHKRKGKGKSSVIRGSAVEKKHPNRRSSIGNVSDPPHLRLLVPGNNRSLLEAVGQSRVEVLDYAVGGQDSKCGSSCFLGGSLAKVHFSIAEAS